MYGEGHPALICRMARPATQCKSLNIKPSHCDFLFVFCRASLPPQSSPSVNLMEFKYRLDLRNQPDQLELQGQKYYQHEFSSDVAIEPRPEGAYAAVIRITEPESDRFVETSLNWNVAGDLFVTPGFVSGSTEAEQMVTVRRRTNGAILNLLAQSEAGIQCKVVPVSTSEQQLCICFKQKPTRPSVIHLTMVPRILL